MDADRFLTQTLRDLRVASILAAAIEAADPGALVKDYLQKAHLPEHRRVFLLGIGKAAESMTQAASELLSSFTNALVITKHASYSARLPMAVMEGGHPIPDERSLAAGRAALEFVSTLNEDDLLVCLISGGGSALVTLPRQGITLEEIQTKTARLLAGGATINEINALRRQLDRLKAGGLARATRARVVSLILSDVIGNSLETIASGLTVDPSLGARVRNIIIGDIRMAAQASQKQAAANGFDSKILDLHLRGEAREVGVRLARRLKDERGRKVHPFCSIAGGETTVTVRGQGKGGRNQELALAAVDELGGTESVLLISLATDGEDGPSGAAGAVVSGQTGPRAQSLGMRASAYLSQNDAYSFFDPLGDLIRCGSTGTNVDDLVFLVGLEQDPGKEQKTE